MSAPTGLPATALLTGAAGHLGRAVAAHLRQHGVRLLLLDRDGQALQQAFGADSGCLPLAVDLLNAQAVQAAVAEGAARLGGLAAACHIAGGFRMGEAVHQTTSATWDFLMDLNARSLLHVAQAAVPHLIESRGRLVTVGAGAALKGAAHMGAYSASKSALIRLTEALSAELKEQGVNVNCVLPSIIDTPDNRAAMPDADPARWVTPQALAQVMTFLLSDSARAIHGAAIPVTGLV